LKNNWIQQFRSGELNGTTAAGDKSASVPIKLNYPSGVTLDADNYLFILDNKNHRVVGTGPYGFQCLLGCSEGGSAPDQLFYPFYFGFDSFRNMFVVDKVRH
ncbi:unnamed protein product, partial [Adineta steineri]